MTTNMNQFVGILQAEAENKYLSVLNRHLTNYSETTIVVIVRNLKFVI